jgi:hypothetical protein
VDVLVSHKSQLSNLPSTYSVTTSTGATYGVLQLVAKVLQILRKRVDVDIPQNPNNMLSLERRAACLNGCPIETQQNQDPLVWIEGCNTMIEISGHGSLL